MLRVAKTHHVIIDTVFNSDVNVYTNGTYERDFITSVPTTDRLYKHSDYYTCLSFSFWAARYAFRSHSKIFKSKKVNAKTQQKDLNLTFHFDTKI